MAPSDTSNQTYAAHAQFFISNLVALIRPDVLVMDTLPQGSFGEFLSMKAFCKKKVFINRHKKESVSQHPLHQSMLPLYDLILSPTQTSSDQHATIPDSLKDRHFYTGEIHSFRLEQAWSRAQVRTYFGVEADQSLVYISAGGGGDSLANAHMQQLIEGALRLPQVKILAAYGPLFTGKRYYHPRVIPFSETGASRYFKGIDAAISAGGYNSFQELLVAGVPTSFFAQGKRYGPAICTHRKGSAGWVQS